MEAEMKDSRYEDIDKDFLTPGTRKITKLPDIEDMETLNGETSFY